MSDILYRPAETPENSQGARPSAHSHAPLSTTGANVIQKNWQELIRPNKLQTTVGSDPKRAATVVAEPLERGFGVTLGNALRRILLSSLQGAAVQSVHIDGVLHEFSSIAGVREDVTDIVLNIKDIAIKMQGEGPKRMVVKKQGPGTVTASDIQTVGDIVVLRWHARATHGGPFGPLPATAGRATVVLNLSAGGDLVEASANLFAHLRALDATGAASIAVMRVPHHGLGAAINDRLARAAAPRLYEP